MLSKTNIVVDETTYTPAHELVHSPLFHWIFLCIKQIKMFCCIWEKYLRATGKKNSTQNENHKYCNAFVIQWWWIPDLWDVLFLLRFLLHLYFALFTLDVPTLMYEYKSFEFKNWEAKIIHIFKFQKAWFYPDMSIEHFSKNFPLAQFNVNWYEMTVKRFTRSWYECDVLYKVCRWKLHLIWMIQSTFSVPHSHSSLDNKHDFWLSSVSSYSLNGKQIQ